ncbi:MAG: glycosyltransferase family 39 protein [Terriglobales bacterium]
MEAMNQEPAVSSILNRAAPETDFPQAIRKVILRDNLLLAAVTLLCLLPFSGKAFHVDDIFFVSAARQIVQHPLDPYGFKIVWYTIAMPMAEVTKNPPLASYYGALIGVVAGWSERAWHFGFLLPGLALILGTYRLAGHFTQQPLIAAAGALLTPVFMVSATGVMCDVLMLALWVWAAIFWIDGLDPAKPAYLMTSALLVAAAALTKYFGASLILLLLFYALMRQPRVGSWVWYLSLPVAALAGYHSWTYALYGRGLLADAAVYAHFKPAAQQLPLLQESLIGLSFAGGCVISALTMAPLLWPRKQMAIGVLVSALAGLAVAAAWVNLSTHIIHLGPAGIQLALFVAGGISLLALAVSDAWTHRDADSLFLTLWVLGTFVFAVYVNWTANGRSILPIIPAAGILIARRLDTRPKPASPVRLWVPLGVAGVFALWIACADAGWANSAKRAAEVIHQKTQTESGTVWFAGHWGFQYYMQANGARPVDVSNFSSSFRAGDFVVLPKNNTNLFEIAPQFVISQEVIELPMPRRAATMCPELGAGFYSSVWGPLPFAIGPVAPERYLILRLGKPPVADKSL